MLLAIPWPIRPMPIIPIFFISDSCNPRPSHRTRSEHFLPHPFPLPALRSCLVRSKILHALASTSTHCAFQAGLGKSHFDPNRRSLGVARAEATLLGHPDEIVLGVGSLQQHMP